jgi:hypothetical protein
VARDLRNAALVAQVAGLERTSEIVRLELEAAKKRIKDLEESLENVKENGVIRSMTNKKAMILDLVGKAGTEKDRNWPIVPTDRGITINSSLWTDQNTYGREVLAAWVEPFDAISEFQRFSTIFVETFDKNKVQVHLRANGGRPTSIQLRLIILYRPE